MTVAESSHTPPSAWCAHPERWSACDGDSAETEVGALAATFVMALKPEWVLETGTAFGCTALRIAAALATNELGQLFSIERDPSRVERARAALLRAIPSGGGRVTVINADSLLWAPPTDVRFGFAFFDGGHRTRAQEFLHFRPWIETGAIVGFHDTGPQHPVRPQLEQLADAGYLRPIFLRTPRGVAFAEVLA